MIKLEITQEQVNEIIREAVFEGFDVWIIEGVLQDEYLITTSTRPILIASEYVNHWKSRQVLLLTPTEARIQDFISRHEEGDYIGY